MAKTNVEIKWHGKELESEVDKKMGDMLAELGQEIISAADAPVDTGFLRDSAYVVTETTNTFNETRPTGTYNGKTRERVPGPEQPRDGGAVVGWAAVYAFHVEQRRPFIYPALLRVASSS